MRMATGGWLLLALPMLGVESTSVNCTFQSDPDAFLGHQAAHIARGSKCPQRITRKNLAKLSRSRKVPPCIGWRTEPLNPSTFLIDENRSVLAPHCRPERGSQ